MKRIGIFYGSTTGNTESIAKKIASVLDADLYNIADNNLNKMNDYNYIIIGASTWGYGDLQDDWETYIGELANIDLSNKKIAFFGLGDSEVYPDTFVDAIGIIYSKIESQQCKIVGQVDRENYNFNESLAIKNGKFIGLALDEDNESHLSEPRLNKWIENLSLEF